jgi:unsaturated rhamnogalacturonyl hydrolase
MQILKPFILVILFSFILNLPVQAQKAKEPWSIRMAQFAMKEWPDAISKDSHGNPEWSYDDGFLLKAIQAVWQKTGRGEYFHYITHIMDPLISNAGEIEGGYNIKDYKLDAICTGRMLLFLYKITGKKKYWKAATTLRKQLDSQPRTSEGGFWHKKIYPHQMWLDGLYMAEPFYAHYSKLTNDKKAFTDVAKQFYLMQRNACDPETGLFYHGWDESRKQHWADPVTGRSSSFWGRGIGWYGMALVDALDYFPKDNPYRAMLIHILQRYAKAVRNFQDPKSGLWYQVLNRPNGKENYLEASASAMFIYTFAKGVRKGYLNPDYFHAARKAYKGYINHLITIDQNGNIELHNTNTTSGLGGGRDGSYYYYVHDGTDVNDVKGIAAFILASVQLEKANRWENQQRHPVVLLDHYFNNEHTMLAGRTIPYHYTWQERDNGGFWFWGSQFRRHGGITEMLYDRPDASRLASADIYIIVDPDTKKESDHLHIIKKQDVQVIKKWVKQGGVLVLMGNNKGNANLEDLNRLSEKFGIHFNNDTRNNAHGGHWKRGTFNLTPQVPSIRANRKVLIQGLSTLKVSSPAKALFKAKNGDVIMAVAHVGKGTVFAIGDPWLYNEYLDGRKDMPEGYQNFEAASDLSQWLLEQTKN